jgi:hypothetical protein
MTSDNENESDGDDNWADVSEEPPSKKMNLQDEVSQVLLAAMKPTKQIEYDCDDYLLKIIKQELRNFDKSNGPMGPNLKIVYNFLLEIKPTSVESERVFSISRFFCNKVRNRLSPKALDSLVYLKSYFLKKNIL